MQNSPLGRPNTAPRQIGECPMRIADDDPIRWRTNSLCHTGFTNNKWSDSVSRQFCVDTLALTDIERDEQDFIEWDFKEAHDGR